MSYTAETFFAKIHDDIIRDSLETSVPASLTAAQAFIESNKGNSGLTTKANNLFGMKWTSGCGFEYVTMKTTEYVDGVAVRVDAKFRKYTSWFESIKDHSGLFLRLKRYQNLIGCYDWQTAAENVAADGYATAPDYADTLKNCMRKYELWKWDEEVLDRRETAKLVEESGAQPAPVPVVGPDELWKAMSRMPVLKIASRGCWVSVLQECLGFVGNNVDGRFGTRTEAAVLALQRKYGLKADGIVGFKTWPVVLVQLCR